MTQETRARLFGYEHAFDHPVTIGATIGICLVLLVAPLLFLYLARTGKISADAKAELFRRYYTWLVLIPLLLIPILLGAFWTIIGFGALAAFCYREFARATGLFREKLVSLLVTLGIICIFLAALDKWYGMFVAFTSLSVACIAAFTILEDRPKGYIQRVALGVFALTLFGTCLGYLGYFANDRDYRPMLILIFLTVEANDVFAYITGKTLGKRKLSPNTSPNKTIAGCIGAMVLTTLLVMGLGYFVFAPSAETVAQGGSSGGELQAPWHLAAMGLIISIAGQLGDLMLSSIKRDLGIKDFGVLLPGHGGLLDRFDSIILVGPALFHYIHWFRGIGVDGVSHIFTGGAS